MWNFGVEEFLYFGRSLWEGSDRYGGCWEINCWDVRWMERVNYVAH